jgi:hypothetical protein
MKRRANRKTPISLLQKHHSLLTHLAKCSANDCHHIIKGVSDEVVKLMSQICINVMNKSLTRDPKEAVRRLAPYKKQLRALTKPKTGLAHKRKQLEQKGGFLGTLLGIAIPAITGLIAASRRKR